MFFKKKDENTKNIKIEGMKCENCVKHVNNALSSIDGVTNCKVSLKTNSASIKTNKEIDKEIIKKSIEDAGYKVISID